MKSRRDLVVIGAGRIGLPWAAVMAHDCKYKVTCLDIDKEKVRSINNNKNLYKEKSLQELLDNLSTGDLVATTDYNVIPEHRVIGITINALRGKMFQFIDTEHMRPVQASVPKIPGVL